VSDERVFARWRREADPGHGYAQIPADGMCLSAFLILTDAKDPGKVLLGEPDPSAGWDRVGALDPDRLARVAGHWMLPSCHLMEYESPAGAAVRIGREQLGLGDIVWPAPTIVSDAYARPEQPGLHWDLDFLFRAPWPPSVSLPESPWRRLAFHDPRVLPRAEFARSHQDILGFAGFRTSP
jgi:hypothetical protein